MNSVGIAFLLGKHLKVITLYLSDVEVLQTCAVMSDVMTARLLKQLRSINASFLSEF